MIYILSDIHGHHQRFASIMEQICLKSEDTLYVLGDIIDRNSGGIRILRRLMAMKNAKILLGNHEFMMLRALGHPRDGETVTPEILENATAHWYRNGGQVTHNHLKLLRKTVRDEIVEHLLSLPLHYDITLNGTTYKLVHAAPEESFDGDPKYRNPIHYAVWKRWELDDAPPGDYTLIFGHTPTRHYQDNDPMEVWADDRRICIDCGCAYPVGRLACLRLDDGKIFYSEERKGLL